MTTLAEEIIEGLKEAIAYAKGETTGSRDHVVHMADVCGIREHLRMSQSEFAESYRMPLATLKGWEQGRRALDAMA
jgi:putative transcriptional regulator